MRRGVRRRPGEQDLPKSKNIKFTNGVAVMFWGAIAYGFCGNQLPYHLYTTPYETKGQLAAAFTHLQLEYVAEYREGHKLIPVLKTRNPKRKGGVDWYIYRKRIMKPHLNPFLLANSHLTLMENNAPAHVKHYHVAVRERLNITKFDRLPSSPDLNPIEHIWGEMKDLIKSKLDGKYTAATMCYEHELCS